MMLSYEKIFSIAGCTISYFDMFFLTNSYSRFGFEFKETIPDTLSQRFLKPITRQFTNNTREEEIVGARYGNGLCFSIVVCGHVADYLVQ
jgi:hypothetical protein